MLDLAAEQGVAPALWFSVGERAGKSMPDQMAEELRDHYRANAVRNLRFRRQLGEALRALNADGVEPLVFKGALELLDPEAVRAVRWMSDIDLAVPEEAWAASVEALGSIGYREAPGAEFDHLHELPLSLPKTPGPIDLHRNLGSSRRLNDVLPLAEAIAESSKVEFEGAHARALAPDHQILHSVLHTAVQDLNHAIGGLSVRQLLDLARLIDRHGARLDWERIAARMRSRGLAPALEGHLWLAHRLFGMPLPYAISRGLSARLRESRVIVSFALDWPTAAQRNLRFALAHDYLDWLYGHGGDPYKLARARARHAIVVLRRDGRQAMRQLLQRRV